MSAQEPDAEDGDADDYRIPTIDELDAMRVAAGLSMKDLSDCAGFKSNRFSHILNNDTNPQTRTVRAFLTTLQAFDGHSPSGEQGPDPEPSELVEDDSDGPTEVDVDRIAARLRRLEADAVGEDPTPPDADENLITDGGRCSVDMERIEEIVEELRELETGERYPSKLQHAIRQAAGRLESGVEKARREQRYAEAGTDHCELCGESVESFTLTADSHPKGPNHLVGQCCVHVGAERSEGGSDR